MRMKVWIGVMIIIIAVLSAALIFVYTSGSKSMVLHRFDVTELRRLDLMVERHQQGKGDYLMLIPPIIDSGYWIHEVHSDGRRITWTVDNTRDAHSDQTKKRYVCREIRKIEEKRFNVYVLEQCDNEEQQSIPVFSIRNRVFFQ